MEGVIQISTKRLNDIVEKASVRGAHEALRLAGVPIVEYYSRAELSRKFGKGKIDRMITDGKLIPHRMDNGVSKYAIKEVLSYII